MKSMILQMWAQLLIWNEKFQVFFFFYSISFLFREDVKKKDIIRWELKITSCMNVERNCVIVCAFEIRIYLWKTKEKINVYFFFHINAPLSQCWTCAVCSPSQFFAIVHTSIHFLFFSFLLFLYFQNYMCDFRLHFPDVTRSAISHN